MAEEKDVDAAEHNCARVLDTLQFNAVRANRVIALSVEDVNGMALRNGNTLPIGIKSVLKAAIEALRQSVA
jgi:hypothetical protein